MMKCKNCNQTKSFKEIITEGIKQEVIYDDGYIMEEHTTYTKDEKSNKLICMICGHSHEKYNL